MSTMIPCGKCNGSGHIQSFSYYANGQCFACNGSGKVKESNATPREKFDESSDHSYSLINKKECSYVQFNIWDDGTKKKLSGTGKVSLFKFKKDPYSSGGWFLKDEEFSFSGSIDEIREKYKFHLQNGFSKPEEGGVEKMIKVLTRN